MADRLVAITDIQDGFIRYRPGDALPSDHPDAATWLECGSAVRRSESDTPPTWAKAQMAAAEPGLPGLATGGEATGADLVGRVPMTEQRRRTPWKPPHLSSF